MNEPLCPWEAPNRFGRGKEADKEEGRERGKEEAEARVALRLLQRFEAKKVSNLPDMPLEAVECIAAAGSDEDSVRTERTAPRITLFSVSLSRTDS